MRPWTPYQRPYLNHPAPKTGKSVTRRVSIAPMTGVGITLPLTARDEPTLGFCFLFIASEPHDQISDRLIGRAISALSVQHVI